MPFSKDILVSVSQKLQNRLRCLDRAFFWQPVRAIGDDAPVTLVANSSSIPSIFEP
jgi:hypothetical protein